MAYRFERGSAVQDGICRIATELIDDAIDAAQQTRNAQETVHKLRRTCKKLRGLIRLVRPVFQDYHEENAAFRDAGRVLSVLRDGAVMLETYDSLLDAYDAQVDRARFAPIRRRLTLQHKRLAERGDIERGLTEFRQTMIAARKRVRRWRLAGDGFEALEGGIAKSYKGAKRAMADTLKDPATDTVHEWRKRIKDYGYHARLLAPIWPKAMKPHQRAANDLAELLGQHHDLAVFRQRLGEDAFAGAADLDVLTGLARQRQAALEDEAFPLGARLFAEPAKHITGRWKSYWDTWQIAEPRNALAA